MNARERHEELCDKITALLREYGDIIVSADSHDHDEDCSCNPPDWDHPLAIQHFALIFAIDDNSETSDRRGYWTFSVTPPNQRPYITRGLVEDWIEGFLC